PAANQPAASVSNLSAATAARSRTCSPIATPTRGGPPGTAKAPYGRFWMGKWLPSGTGTHDSCPRSRPPFEFGTHPFLLLSWEPCRCWGIRSPVPVVGRLRAKSHVIEPFMGNAWAQLRGEGAGGEDLAEGCSYPGESPCSQGLCRFGWESRLLVP